MATIVSAFDPDDLRLEDEQGRAVRFHWSRFHGVVVSIDDLSKGPSCYIGDGDALHAWLGIHVGQSDD